MENRKYTAPKIEIKTLSLSTIVMESMGEEPGYWGSSPVTMSMEQLFLLTEEP